MVAFLALAVSGTSRLAAAPPEKPTPPIMSVSSPMTADSLDALVREKRYVDLRAALAGKPHLTRDESDYFQGILDNHTNAVDASVRLLERALPTLRRAQQTERLRLALHALADDYGKRFEYGRAADVARSLEHERFLSEAERRDIQGDADLYDLLRGQAPQTVTFGTSASGKVDSIPGHRNPLGLLEMPVSVGDTGTATPAGQAESWVVDTGANVSTITRSTAERLHLKLLAGKAMVQGIGGTDIPMQVAVIPLLRLGGITVRNVAVLVLDDRALNVGQPAYQIQGIVGFPVLAALGRLTFGPNDQISVGASPPADARSPNLYLDGLTPLVAADTDGTTCLFTLDTGANASVLTARYFWEHTASLTNAPLINYRFAGADGIKSVPARKAPRITLRLDGRSVSLTGLPVLTAPMGNAGNDAFYGNLGQDLLKPFISYTLDFRTMRFTLGAPKV